MSKRLVPVLSLLSMVILLLMLNFTTPAAVGPFGVLVFFAAIYVLMFGVALLLVKVMAKVLGRQKRKKHYLYAAVIAFGPIMLLLAQSLGSMSWLTIGLTLVFVSLGCFLISKRA